MTTQNNVAAETAPLLGPTASDNGQDSRDASPIREHIRKWWSFYICAAFILSTDIPNFVSEGPRLQMLELSVCRDYHAEHGPAITIDTVDDGDLYCKLPAIQSKLSMVRGVMALLEAIPGLLLAIPYGILADVKGRRLVLTFCITGFLLRDFGTFICLYFYNTFPLQSVYIASLMVIVGGGSTVISPMLLAVVTASLPAESRTQGFLMIHVAILLVAFVAPPLASVLMASLGPYMAYLACIPFEASGYFFVYLISSEKKAKDISPADDAQDDTDGSSTTMQIRLKTSVNQATDYLRRDLGKIVSNRSLLIGLMAGLVSKMDRPILELLLQFMSVKFEWPIRKTIYLLSVQAAAQLPLFLVILPVAYASLLRIQGSATAANKTLAIVSACCFALGSLFLGLSPTAPLFITSLVLYMAGSGYGASLRSVLTSLVAEDQITFLFTTISVFDGLAVLASGPLLQLSYSWGVNVGGLAASTPFFILTGLYTVAIIGLSLCDFRP